LAASDLPFLQVACKCDVNPEPVEDIQVDAIHERYEIYRTSFSSPRSQRMCIALVLRAVISTREGKLKKYFLFFIFVVFAFCLGDKTIVLGGGEMNCVP
jgi:hypothetical protein